MAADPWETYSTTSGDTFATGLARPPGYPGLLWLFRLLPGGIETAALGQLAVGVLCVWLTIELGRKLLDPVTAAIAGWWVALDPLHVVESSILLTEIPFSAAILTGIIAVSRAILSTRAQIAWWTLAGLALGVATLIRPISLYLPVLLLVLIPSAAAGRLGWRRASLCAVSLFLAAAVPVALWAYRNYTLTDVPIVSTIEGTNMVNYRAVGALIEETDLSVSEARSLINSELAPRVDGLSNPAQVSRAEMDLGVEIILNHPVGYSISATKGLVRSLIGPGRAHIGERFDALAAGHEAALILTGISAMSAFAATSLSLISVWNQIKNRQWLVVLLLGIPLSYLLLVGSGFESYSRFRLQFFPILALLAAIAVPRFLITVRQRTDNRKFAAP